MELLAAVEGAGYVDDGLSIADQCALAATVVAQADELARLRGIVEGRTTPPTDEEIEAHWRAKGIWFVTSPVWHESIRGRTKAESYAEDHRENDSQWTWVAADATGRPTAWPTTGGER